ncbi:response regulator [Rhodospirillaceae bacterium KN72]|uniref:Response regulator n=1 Tax=Pacificispira spongiicola TaxID=2729598 RepID=A0A7Y0DZL4_9PROT|nr:response regulator [Pacificispira spongiicola]NMM44518.1 response regulator [Pacificispira spongiicola]
MARLDFTRLSVLLVEDSAFMRSVFVNVLRALGVERILIAEDGEQAIKIMTPAAGTKGTMIGTSGVDLIICDYFMPTVDGAMFLRWLRRSDRSPDRFIPVIMVSAAADMDVIFTARDAGVDEFLAKPFSAAMLAQRLTAVIEHPRPYIYCPRYFGPDRRRRAKPVQEDQRILTEKDVEVVYSGKDLSALKNSSKMVWEFRIPRGLKAKLAGGRSGDPNEPAFDPALIEAAEGKIANMEGDYADWVAHSIDELSQAHHRMVEEPERAVLHMATVHEIAHELRGQGGIFGYPLMTQFGKSLYDVTDEESQVSPQLLDLIDAHIDLIKVVTKQKIKGDGGSVGQQLLKSLSEAKKKFGH